MVRAAQPTYLQFESNAGPEIRVIIRRVGVGFRMTWRNDIRAAAWLALICGLWGFSYMSQPLSSVGALLMAAGFVWLRFGTRRTIVVADSPGATTGPGAWASSLLAGAIGFGLAYYTWCKLIVVPLEATPAHRLGPDLGGPVAHPWPFWWVAAAITGAAGVLAWRRLAVRTPRVSLSAGMIAMTLTFAAVFPISAIVIDLVLVVQFVQPPSPLRIMDVLPMAALDAAFMAPANLVFQGIPFAPVAAVLGFALAGVSRLVIRGERA
jgi:hypothetical protein